MASPTTRQSARSGSLAERLRSTGTETTIDIDVSSDNNWDTNTGVAKINTGTSSEWVAFTAITTGATANGVTRQTLTGVTRGLKKDATSLTDNDTSIQQDHAVGSPIKIVHHSAEMNKLVQNDADNTLSGANTISGTTTYTGTTESALVVQSVTTTERDAFTTTTNGNIIYNETAGEFQVYQGGAWSTVSSGSTQPNASTTVAGKVEEATVAEQIALTATGATGARLYAAVANMVNSSAGAGDEGKILLLDSSGTFDGSGLPDGLAKYVARANHTGVQASSTINDTGTAGETLAAGDWVYEDSADGKLNKATQDVSSDSESWNVIGVIVTGGAADAAVTYQPLVGMYTTTGLTAGSTYYLGTGGALTTTSPAMNSATIVPVIVGVARSTTELIFKPQRLQRRVFATGTNATASGTTDHTAGFPISHVIYSGGSNNGASPNASFGYYDAVAGAQAGGSTYEAISATYMIFLHDSGAGSQLQGAASVNSNNLRITWSGGTIATHRYVVQIFERL